MPTSLLSFALYVLALFPGIAFAFARDGHRPSGKRSVLRETAAIVFVSTVCDTAVALFFIALTVVEPTLRLRVFELLSEDYTWFRQNFALTGFVLVAALAAATLLGFVLGGKRAHRLALQRLWRAEIDRDVSAWRRLLGPDDDYDVRVALNMKSGAWLSGSVYEFDPDPDNGPHRTLTLNGDLRYRAPGATVDQKLSSTEWVVVEAEQIEMLHATWTTPSGSLDPAPGGSQARPTWWARWARWAAAVGAVVSVAGAVFSGGTWLSPGGLASGFGIILLVGCLATAARAERRH